MEVIFFPKSTIPINVCNHRYGADMTYTEQTDTIRDNSRYEVEFYAHKYGARVGAFITRASTDSVGDKLEAEKYGSCKFDIYFPTDTWYNIDKDIYEGIPDYYGAEWSQRGIDAFAYDDGGLKIDGEPALIGSPKPTRYPNFGEQMYNCSGGRYGWSGAVIGSSNALELTKLQENVINWYKNQINRYPSSMSYRNGANGGKDLMIVPFLQCRNSGTGMWNNIENSQTWYGDGLGNPDTPITREVLSSRASSSRFWDWAGSMGSTIEESLTGVANLIGLTLTNNGWQNNFTHWHSAYNTSKDELKLKVYDDYFRTISEAKGASRIHFCNYGEASEYLIYKLCIDKVAAYQEGANIKVMVSLKDPFKGDKIENSNFDADLPYNRINTPISLEVDLSGTFLEGKNIKSNYGKVVNSGSNKIIVQVPFPKDKTKAVMGIKLFEVDTPEYLSIEQPIVSNVVVNGKNVSFKTDIPCFSVVFEKTDENNITKFKDRYVSEYKTLHSVEVGDDTSKSYHIGVISEAGITNLYDI